MRWRYVGEGRALLDIPARDIYADEVLAPELVAVLVASSLYLAAGEAVTAPATTRGSIDLADGVNDIEAHLAGKALRSRKKG